MVTKEQYKEAFEYFKTDEEERIEHNANIIIEIINEKGDVTLKSYKELLDGVYVTDKLQIVDKPEGGNNDEEFGIFTEVWVDQWGVGDSGDSFEGFIYGKFANNKWLKIPYSC